MVAMTYEVAIELFHNFFSFSQIVCKRWGILFHATSLFNLWLKDDQKIDEFINEA